MYVPMHCFETSTGLVSFAGYHEVLLSLMCCLSVTYSRGG